MPLLPDTFYWNSTSRDFKKKPFRSNTSEGLSLSTHYRKDVLIISEKRKAVLYLRYSSNSQTEQSIEGQRRVCREYTSRNDIEIVGEYVDRAASASHDTQRRKNFLQMISDSSRKSFDAVVVYKLDRFARNRYDSANYKQKLKANGVQVLSATEGLTDSPESVMLESVLEGMAEYYSLELSQKVSRGIRESVEKRNFLGGPIPFGFIVSDKKLIPDPEKTGLVQEIFEKAAQGYSLTALCQTLMSKGLRKPNGKPYTRASLHRMLRSKRYIGYYIYGDIEVPNVTEPIVSQEVFKKVQETLSKRQFNKNSREKFLLTGKLYCGHCGELMTGESGTSSTGQRYSYYKCYGKRKKSGCSKKNVSKDLIEDIVIQKAREYLTDENIEKIASAVMDECNQSDFTVEVDRIRKDIDSVSKEIDNFVALIGKGVMSDAIVNALQEAETRKAQLVTSLDEAERNLLHLDEDMVVFWLERIRDRTDPEDGKTLIDAFIQRADLYDDEDDSGNRKLVLSLNIADNDGNSSSTVSLASPFECSQFDSVKLFFFFRQYLMLLQKNFFCHFRTFLPVFS